MALRCKLLCQLLMHCLASLAPRCAGGAWSDESLSRWVSGVVYHNGWGRSVMKRAQGGRYLLQRTPASCSSSMSLSTSLSFA